MEQSARNYFDCNATAPLRPEAREAILAALGRPGNASSVHGEGRAARALVEKARGEVAALVGAEAREVIFTSGATEANILALSPSLGDALFVSAIEHPSVRAGGRFATVTELPVTPAGILDLAAAEQAIARAQKPVVSLMLANNETGVTQPVRELADVVHAKGGVLHVDAAQAPGRLAVDMKALGADLLTISGHKLGGPQGTGALVVRNGLAIEPLIRGGGQERNRRAGTENVAAIAGFGAASASARSFETDAKRMIILRNRIEADIRAATPRAIIVGAEVARLPNTILVAVPGMSAETAIIAFDLAGIALSSGAACSSGKVSASHVLAAIGLDENLAKSALRISFGGETTENEVESLLNAWRKLVPSLSKARPDTAEQRARSGAIAVSAA
jgi:cysteine desulfurase